jgi:SAM-dependent methyltransferase
MDLAGWERRYLSGERATEDLDAPPTKLLIDTARHIRPGKALDLACGTGRNALWLAEHGWQVTAIDGAHSAIEILRCRASRRALAVDARVADLEKSDCEIAPASWDLIAICYYLQRNLFEPAKQGVTPGGILIAIVHTTERNEEPTATRMKPGELAEFFSGWEILHQYEGTPDDIAHRRAVAEIVARRPKGWQQ